MRNVAFTDTHDARDFVNLKLTLCFSSSTFIATNHLQQSDFVETSKSKVFSLYILLNYTVLEWYQKDDIKCITSVILFVQRRSNAVVLFNEHREGTSHEI